ncbi:MAG: hypothetical protein AAFP68_13385 [Pseudomonadota bacterium]
MTDGVRTSAGLALPLVRAAAIAAVLIGVLADQSFAGEEDDAPQEPATPEWWANPEPANGRVIMNGQVLTESQISTFAFFACGPIAPGNYWFNVQSGLWGIAGDGTPLGHFRDRCQGRRRYGDGTLSPRNWMYRPGELEGDESDWGGPRLQ